MKKYEYFGVLLVLTALFFSVYLKFENNKLINQCSSFEQELKKIYLRDSLNTLFHGMYIWEISNIEKKEFNEFIIANKLETKYNLLVIIDSISCLKCYDFHAKNWALQSNKTPIIIFTQNLFKMVQSDLKYKNIYQFKMSGNITFNNQKFHFIIFLLNSDGRVIYYDIAEPNKLQLSKRFYNVLRHYNNEK